MTMRKNTLFAIAAMAFTAVAATGMAAPISAPQAVAAIQGMQLADSSTMTVAPMNGTQVSVHQQPDNTSRVLSTVDAGVKVTVLDWLPNGVWAHVQTNDGITGYLPADSLR